MRLVFMREGLLSLDLRRGASMASGSDAVAKAACVCAAAWMPSPTADARTRGTDRGTPTREPAPDAVDAPLRHRRDPRDAVVATTSESAGRS